MVLTIKLDPILLLQVANVVAWGIVRGKGRHVPRRQVEVVDKVSLKEVKC